MERAFREFIKQYGIERSAFPGEIQKIFAGNGENRARCPVPELIHHGGHYLVKGSGEIIFVSAPCALNRQVTEGINDFCREHEWNYEVRPAAEPHGSEVPLRVVFSTRFFVSPA